MTNLRTAANAKVGGVSLPSGFRQSILAVASQLDAFLTDLATISTLITRGKALFTALDGIVGQPDQLANLLSNPAALKPKLEAVQTACAAQDDARRIPTSRRSGAPDGARSDRRGEEVLGAAADLLELLEMLTGEELVVRFDWNPKIESWGCRGRTTRPLFRANDPHGFLIAVEAQVKKAGGSAPKITVVCSLKNFDGVHRAGGLDRAQLREDRVQRRYRREDGRRCAADDMKFVGPLSFVER